MQDEEVREEDQLQALGGNPALDLLNTVALRNGESVDFIMSGSDVLEWLDRAGWPLTKGSALPCCLACSKPLIRKPATAPYPGYRSMPMTVGC